MSSIRLARNFQKNAHYEKVMIAEKLSLYKSSWVCYLRIEVDNVPLLWPKKYEARLKYRTIILTFQLSKHEKIMRILRLLLNLKHEFGSWKYTISD